MGIFFGFCLVSRPPPPRPHIHFHHRTKSMHAAGPLEITDTAYSYDAYAYYIAVITSLGNDTTIGKVEFYWHREEA